MNRIEEIEKKHLEQISKSKKTTEFIACFICHQQNCET